MRRGLERSGPDCEDWRVSTVIGAGAPIGALTFAFTRALGFAVIARSFFRILLSLFSYTIPFLSLAYDGVSHRILSGNGWRLWSEQILQSIAAGEPKGVVVQVVDQAPERPPDFLYRNGVALLSSQGRKGSEDRRHPFGEL
jgi:hypothetical protein